LCNRKFLIFLIWAVFIGTISAEIFQLSQLQHPGARYYFFFHDWQNWNTFFSINYTSPYHINSFYINYTHFITHIPHFFSFFYTTTPIFYWRGECNESSLHFWLYLFNTCYSRTFTVFHRRIPFHTDFYYFLALFTCICLFTSCLRPV
jgi:hypothetical protein